MLVQRICSPARRTRSARQDLQPSEIQKLISELTGLRDVLADMSDRLRTVEVHLHEQAPTTNQLATPNPVPISDDLPVAQWTGKSANALRHALRMTHEAFAFTLGVSVRGVAKWSAEPTVVPITELQSALDTLLSRASGDEKTRFRLITATAGITATAVAA